MSRSSSLKKPVSDMLDVPNGPRMPSVVKFVTFRILLATAASPPIRSKASFPPEPVRSVVFIETLYEEPRAMNDTSENNAKYITTKRAFEGRGRDECMLVLIDLA